MRKDVPKGLENAILKLLSKNPKDHEYTHLTLTNRIKRMRYKYQMQKRKENQ